MIRALVRSLRPRQWIKNIVVFAPLFFSGQALETVAFGKVMAVFVCFSLASGAVYLINDLCDWRVDQLHPRKKYRPIASGELPRSAAVMAATVLATGSISWSFTVGKPLGTVMLLFFTLNLLYSFLLKRIVIVDVLSLSFGYVLRVWAGAVVLDLAPSHWLQLSLWFLALFLSLAKRRQELATLHAKSLQHRQVLSSYTESFIDQMTSILAAIVILCYAVYSVSPDVVLRLGPFGFIATVPWVVYGIFRYLYLIHVRGETFDPTESFLSDGPLVFSALGWIACTFLLLYR